MNQIIDQIARLLQEGIAAIFKLLQIGWTWSFGQIIGIFQSGWQNLPAWKLAVLALVVAGVVYVLYKAALEVWSAGENLLKAFLSLISVLVSVLPYVLVAGLIAFAGGWVIRSVNL
jgi:hypothetical protein